MIGRKLKSCEVVHHINEDKLNNSPDNLIVISSQKIHLQLERELAREYVQSIKGNKKEVIMNILSRIEIT